MLVVTRDIKRPHIKRPIGYILRGQSNSNQNKNIDFNNFKIKI